MRSIPKRNEKKRDYLLQNRKFFIPLQSQINMVPIVQLVRMSDCGSEGRGFEPHLAPLKSRRFSSGLFCCRFSCSIDPFWVILSFGVPEKSGYDLIC